MICLRLKFESQSKKIKKGFKIVQCQKEAIFNKLIKAFQNKFSIIDY